MAMKPNDFQPVRCNYPSTIIKQVIWKLKDVEEIPPTFNRNAIIGPLDFVASFRFLFQDQIKERFIVAVLNTANKVQAIEIVSEGILNSSLVHPREVFRAAIVLGAAAIIVAHNHPSGNPEPSQEDIAITKQLVEAGKIIGIPVHDHIIFAGAQYSSFVEKGLL